MSDEQSKLLDELTKVSFELEKAKLAEVKHATEVRQKQYDQYSADVADAKRHREEAAEEERIRMEREASKFKLYKADVEDVIAHRAWCQRAWEREQWDNAVNAIVTGTLAQYEGLSAKRAMENAITVVTELRGPRPSL